MHLPNDLNFENKLDLAVLALVWIVTGCIKQYLLLHMYSQLNHSHIIASPFHAGAVVLSGRPSSAT